MIFFCFFVLLKFACAFLNNQADFTTADIEEDDDDHVSSLPPMANSTSVEDYFRTSHNQETGSSGYSSSSIESHSLQCSNSSSADSDNEAANSVASSSASRFRGDVSAVSASPVLEEEHDETLKSDEENEVCGKFYF